MTLEEKYLLAIRDGQFQADASQANAVSQLNTLYLQLEQSARRPRSRLSSFFKKQQHIQGLYLWGGTGRGKTCLMDAFYSCLEFPEKHRLHFHRFMRDIHAQIREHEHIEDPLKVIGKEWANKYRLLCLDEFHVTDITDAMILARLLEALFSNGVTIVTTSNIAIENLYENGLQRSSFLPAIGLLHQYMHEIELGDGKDYRFGYMQQAKTYYVTAHGESCAELEMHFSRLADVEAKHDRSIIINERHIRYLACANDIIWFDFSELCRTARSAIDYLEIAQCFEAVFISNVQHMNDAQNDVARRFLHLIDALYDHRVKVFISADALPDVLYTGKNMAFAFARAVSRLSEMASQHYLGEAHH